MTTGNTITESASTDSDPAGAFAVSEDSDRVNVLIGELPENQQKVIRLKFYSGLKYREISEATGLSEGNVGFLLHKAIGTLRERMQWLGTVG